MFIKLHKKYSLLDQSIKKNVQSFSNFGNKCGHDKEHPILTPTNYNSPSKLPKILQDAISSVKTFYSHPEKLDDLRYGRKSSAKNASVTNRAIRSERREAICRVLELMLSNLDLVSCRIGIPAYNKNAFILLDTYWMAEATGLSYWRVHRAVRDLKHAQFISVVERCEADKNDIFVQFKSRTAIRVVKNKLLMALGISEKRIKKEREKAYQRQAEKLEKIGRNGSKPFDKYFSKTSNIGRRPQRIRQYLNTKVKPGMREHILRRQHYLRCYDPTIEKLPREEQLEAVNAIIIKELSRT